jgi:hypothetical protein
MPLDMVKHAQKQECGKDLTQTRVASANIICGLWGCPVPRCWIRELAHTRSTVYVRGEKRSRGIGLLVRSTLIILPPPPPSLGVQGSFVYPERLPARQRR